jgi:hypothetical protein
MLLLNVHCLSCIKDVLSIDNDSNVAAAMYSSDTSLSGRLDGINIGTAY